jgi:hypothetical protein
LEAGATGDGDNRNHTFYAFWAACCLIHEMILPIFPLWLSGSMMRGNQITHSGFIETCVARLLWRYPSLGYRTLNKVPLYSFAFWASERS